MGAGFSKNRFLSRLGYVARPHPSHCSFFAKDGSLILRSERENDGPNDENDCNQDTHRLRVSETVAENSLNISDIACTEHSQLICKTREKAAHVSWRQLVHVRGNNTSHTLHEELHQDYTNDNEHCIRRSNP